MSTPSKAFQTGRK